MNIQLEKYIGRYLFIIHPLPSGCVGKYGCLYFILAAKQRKCACIYRGGAPHIDTYMGRLNFHIETILKGTFEPVALQASSSNELMHKLLFFGLFHGNLAAVQFLRRMCAVRRREREGLTGAIDNFRIKV